MYTTFKKWNAEMDKECQMVTWLDCDEVTKLRCSVCTKFKARILCKRNYSERWIGGPNLRNLYLRPRAIRPTHTRNEFTEVSASKTE